MHNYYPEPVSSRDYYRLDHALPECLVIGHYSSHNGDHYRVRKHLVHNSWSIAHRATAPDYSPRDVRIISTLLRRN